MSGPAARPLAEVAEGRLAGAARGAVRVFRGIPFGAPPTGELRFAAPRPPQPWRGTREALRSAPPSLQLSPSWRRDLAPGPMGSEDCLYLDVYAPADPGPHPVLVWIHGGGGVAGAVADCDGTALAERGVVVAAIAYRLGALGLLHLPGAFAPEPGCNLALLDQVAALRWVAGNVAAFGGDPERVTVAGGSNGGRTVGTLLATPAARGLFRQAVVMSGTGVGQLVATPEEAERATAPVLAALGLARPDAQRLREAPAEELLAAQACATGTIPFQVVVDGEILPRRPLDAVADGAARDVPLLIGTTADECDGFTTGPLSAPSDDAHSLLLAPEPLARAEAAFRRALPADWSDAEVRRRAVTAADWWLPAIRFAEAAVRAGGRAWMYRLDWRLAPRGQGCGAPHGLDQQVFSPALPDDELRAAARRDLAELAPVVEQMRDALARFALDTAPGGPAWPPYELARRATYVFDDRSRLVDDPDAELRGAWDALGFTPGP